jgi:iron complex outermembrane receptor protein
MHKAILKIGVAAMVLHSGLALALNCCRQPMPQPRMWRAPHRRFRRRDRHRHPRQRPESENSASPIQVLDAASLLRTGQPDLIQALAQNLPSFTRRPSAATPPT